MITVDGKDESGCWRFVYPDGFVKHHQGTGVEDYARIIAQQLRGRFGVTSIEFVAMPKKMDVGQVFTVVCQ